jgi:hypothetical protein
MKHVREFAGLLLMALGCLLCWDVDRTVNTAHDQIPMMAQQYASIPGDIHSLTTEFNKDSGTIATDIHRDVVVAGGAEGETEKTMRLIRSEAPSFIAQGHQELAATHDLLVSAKLTTGEAQRAIAEISTLPEHANPLLDSLAKASDSVSPAMNGLTNYVNGPLTFATSNAGELEDSVNLTVDQGRKRWVAPWDGTHPYRHYAGVGLGYVGIGATLVRDAK